MLAALADDRAVGAREHHLRRHRRDLQPGQRRSNEGFAL
jgi:hypothetical protein